MSSAAPDGWRGVQKRLSIWEVVYSSLLHPQRRPGRRQSERTSAVHHRIALFNSQHQIVQMISQTDILRFLHDNTDQIEPCLNVRLTDVPGAHPPGARSLSCACARRAFMRCAALPTLECTGTGGQEAPLVCGAGLCSHTVVTIQSDKSVLEALRIMRERCVSGVAVVDAAGHLLGSFSMAELRSIMVEQLAALALPVSQFLALPSQAQSALGTHRSDAHLVLALASR